MNAQSCIAIVVFLVLAFFASPPPASGADLPALRTVERVDLARYTGTWFEIARLPNRFQQGCVGSAASYSLRSDGEIDVVNSCRSEDDCRLRQVRGRAWSVDPASNAKLKVSFFWPFRGDYWIVELGKDYEYAVVGTPNRKYLWLLSRSDTMDDAVYAAIMQRVEQKGFDLTRIMKVSPDARPKETP